MNDLMNNNIETVTETVTETNNQTPTLEETAQTLGVSTGDLETFRPYDSSLPVPELKGFRTVKCLYKVNPKTKTSAGENSYIRVADYITEDLVIGKVQELASVIIGYLQTEEDKLIKSYHLTGVKTVKESDLTIESIIEAIEASGTSQRLNKEKIESWFTTEMEVSLYGLFATKLQVIDTDNPTDDEIEKIAGVLGAYKSKFVGLASGKTHYREPDIKALQAVLSSTGADNTFIGGRFSLRLEKMLQTDSDSLLLSLG